MRVGLVTCKNLPEPDPDAAPLEAALKERGHSPILLAWDDEPTQPIGLPELELDVIVIRSPWNYFTAPTDFLVWILGAYECAAVINSPDVVKWNHHKKYLLQLVASGVPTVPTRLLRMPDGAAAKDAIASFDDVVIKPAVSAGSFGAKRFDSSDDASAFAHAMSLLKEGDILIQPFMNGFQDPGERSLIWIDGEWTHAIRKSPRFDGQVEKVDVSERPSPQELKVANAAIQAVPHKIHYARADLVETKAGPVLSELELMEPSLFFNHCQTALDRFVVMIEKCGGRNS